MSNSPLLGVFGAPQFIVESGSGSILRDIDGKEYIDMLGGIAVNTLGHANKEIAETIYQQALKVSHHSNFFTNPSTLSLGTKILDLAKAPRGSKVFFANSGTEAVEAALKIVKKYANSDSFAEKLRKIGKTIPTEGKPARILALINSFHGRTCGALSITYKAKYRDPFAPLIPNVEFIETNNLDVLEMAFSDLSAEKKGPVVGMFVECIQGEAGVKPLFVQFLARARELTKKNGALLVIDEVQTGIGRTASWFAHQNEVLFPGIKIQPDIMSMAKGLGAGFPIGGIVTFGDEVSNILTPGSHGTTFGGNPLATTVALKNLEIIERDNLLDNAYKVAELAAKVVTDFNNPEIVELRGAGCLLALEFKCDGYTSADIQKGCLGNGLIVNAVNENSLRLAPALNIELDTVEKALNIINDVVKDLAEKGQTK
ncbi:MAG: aminotransferase class III-fold pyridoxal phosphate-dependent enzyme [Candidatus Ancillula sp.]|nr:aminotransferase class III-fold pyridoxal phosphate-dependent enzyme [Candidatus Ancillula sp.]